MGIIHEPAAWTPAIQWDMLYTLSAASDAHSCIYIALGHPIDLNVILMASCGQHSDLNQYKSSHTSSQTAHCTVYHKLISRMSLVMNM